MGSTREAHHQAHVVEGAIQRQVCGQWTAGINRVNEFLLETKL